MEPTKQHPSYKPGSGPLHSFLTFCILMSTVGFWVTLVLTVVKLHQHSAFSWYFIASFIVIPVILTGSIILAMEIPMPNRKVQ